MKGKKKEDEKQNRSLLRETERLQKKEEEIRAKARKKAERKQLDRLVDHVLDVYEKEKGQEKAKHHVQKLDVLFPGMGMTKGLSEEELQPKKVQLDTVMRKATRDYRPDQQRKKSGSAILGKSRSRTTTSASPLPSRHSPHHHGRGRNEDERGGGGRRRRATTSTAPSAPFQPTKLSASASASPTSPSSPLTSSARMSREKGAIVEPRKRDEEERRGEEEADEKRSTLRRHKSFSDVAETRTKDKLDVVPSPTAKQKEDRTAKETKKKEEKKRPKKKEKEKEEPKERRKKEAKKKTKKPEAEKKEDADHSFARTGGRHRSKTEASPPPPSFVAALAAEDVPSSRHSGSFLPLTPEPDSKQLKELSQADAPTASKSGSWITRRRSGSAIFRGMKTKKEAVAAKKDKKKKDKPAKKEKKKKGSSKREKEKEKGKENDKEVVLKVDISSSTSSFNSSLHHKNEEDTKENEQRQPHKANEEDVDEEEIDFILNGGRSGSGTGAEKSEKMIRDKLNRRKEDFWLDTDNLSSVAEISDPFHSDDDGINGTADLGEVEVFI